MNELNQDDGQRSVDPSIAYRVAMMHMHELNENLVLARASLHEARSENTQLRKEMTEGFETTNTEISRLTNENSELRMQLAEYMNRNPINDGSDDTEQRVPQEAESQNGQVPSESGA